MSDHAEFWSEDRWTRAYGWRPAPGARNPYRLGYHIAQDIGGRYWLGPVPALRGGTVARVGRSSKVGGFVVIRAGDGLYDAYTHLNSSSMPKLGQPIQAGDSLPRLARSGDPRAGDDYMGSESTGPHLHFGVSTTPTNIFNPQRGRDRDPRPIIRAALARPAGGNSRPVPIPPTPIKEEDEDMGYRIIGVPNKDKNQKDITHYYLSGPGGVKHISGPADLALLRRWVKATPGKEETFRGNELERITSYLMGLGRYVSIPYGT